MKNVIQKLEKEVINQIAAGEVVERPYSVIKELVENAIDAKASRISVKIQDGGKTLMEVSDDGVGMSLEDLKLCTERHTTSKVTTVEDIMRVATLGFRGEALASVAAVSNLKIVSRQREDAFGNMLKVEEGVLSVSEKVSADLGTTVTVKDLFYNTPPRLKFLKKDATEAGNINELLMKLALSNPDISFEFINNGKRIFKTSGRGGLINAIASLYDADTARLLIPVSYEEEHIKIEGFIGKPALSRATRKFQTFFVNHRWVNNQVFYNAAEGAYHTLLTVGRYPFLVLNITIDPEKVDVNFHPSKLQVRFSNEQEVYYALSQAIRLGLKQSLLIPNIGTKGEEAKGAAKKKERPEPVRIPMDDLIKDAFLPKEAKKEDAFIKQVPPKESWEEIEAVLPVEEEEHRVVYFDQADDRAKKEEGYHFVKETEEKPPFIIEDRKKALDSDNLDEELKKELLAKEQELREESKQETFIADTKEENAFPELRLLGQLKDLYIIAGGKDGLYIIDQHAAHERILFNKWYLMLKNAEMITQTLLVPIHVTLNYQEMLFVEEQGSLFEKLGFQVEIFGNNSILIREVPLILGEPVGEAFFKTVIDEMLENENEELDSSIMKEHALMTIACREAIKAQKKLDTIEMETLFRDLRETENPFTCPHGRPTILHFSFEDLEKQFKRI